MLILLGNIQDMFYKFTSNVLNLKVISMILNYYQWKLGSGAVMIVWYLDLQLPMQSEPSTINVMSLNPAQARCLRYNNVIKFVSDLRQVVGFLRAGTPISSTNETDRHDTTEILLKVALNTISLA